MKKRIHLLGMAFLFLIVPLITQAQYSLLKKADLYYELLAFSKAIPKYEQALKRDSSNVIALINLADCYRLTNNNQKSLETYAKVVRLNETKPIHMFLYAQALMMAGKYNEAKTYMSAYAEDERGKIFSKSIEEIKKFYKDADKYKISKASFNSPKNDFSPAIWKNYLVFSSARENSQVISCRNAWTGTNYDALYFTEKKRNGKFRHARIFNEEIQTRYNNGVACFSNDGKYMYFSMNSIVDNTDLRGADEKVHIQIFQATLKNKNIFGDVKDFRYNSIEYNCAHPAVSSNGTRLYFASDMPGGYGGMDLWVSTKEGDNWSKPENLGEKINTSGNEVFPYLFNDNTLYFASNGLEGMGGLDIYKSELNANGLPAGNADNIGAPINSQSDDFGIVFYPNADSGYFSSNFGNLNNDDDIYAFISTKPEPKINIHGTITDLKTNEIIPGVKITLTDKTGTVEDMLTDENGNFSFNKPYGNDYTLIGSKDNYYDTKPIAVSTSVDNSLKEMVNNITLEKMPGIWLVISVPNIKDKMPVSNVRILLTDKVTDKTDTLLTSAEGICNVSLTGYKPGDSLKYNLILSKDEFVTKDMDWEYYIEKAENIDLMVYIGKAEPPNPLGALIPLKPIYFDFEKYNIRSDAALELDKVVEFMKKYPDVKIALESHTDCRGTYSFNQKLSDNRAKASLDYIVARGIAKNRFNVKSYGEKRLVNDCACEGDMPDPCSEEQHAVNRRTEFIIR